MWSLRPAKLEEQKSLLAELWQELWFHMRTEGGLSQFLPDVVSVTYEICGEDDGTAGDLTVVGCAQRGHTANWTGFFIFLHGRDLNTNPWATSDGAWLRRAEMTWARLSMHLSVEMG